MLRVYNFTPEEPITCIVQISQDSCSTLVSDLHLSACQEPHHQVEQPAWGAHVTQHGNQDVVVYLVAGFAEIYCACKYSNGSIKILVTEYEIYHFNNVMGNGDKFLHDFA